MGVSIKEYTWRKLPRQSIPSLKCFVLNQLGEMTHEEFDDSMMREWVKKEFGI